MENCWSQTRAKFVLHRVTWFQQACMQKRYLWIIVQKYLLSLNNLVIHDYFSSFACVLWVITWKNDMWWVFRQFLHFKYNWSPFSKSVCAVQKQCFLKDFGSKLWKVSLRDVQCWHCLDRQTCVKDRHCLITSVHHFPTTHNFHITSCVHNNQKYFWSEKWMSSDYLEIEEAAGLVVKQLNSRLFNVSLILTLNNMLLYCMGTMQCLVEVLLVS